MIFAKKKRLLSCRSLCYALTNVILQMKLLNLILCEVSNVKGKYILAKLSIQYFGCYPTKQTKTEGRRIKVLNLKKH